MTKDNSTGKNRDFYDLGQKIFDRIARSKAVAPPPVQPEPPPWKPAVDLAQHALFAQMKEAQPVQRAHEMAHWAEEYECCMMVLDYKGVPTVDETGVTYSLWGRICAYARAQSVQPDWLLSSTQDLAKHLARRCYPEVPQFEVLADLAGVISQIDNMTTGMDRKAQPVQLVEPEVPNESQINAGMMALLQCSESDLESFSPKMCERYADDVARVYRAMMVPPVQPANDKLLQIIAATYQIAGVYDAPEHVLVVLSDPEGATQAQIDALLPFVQPEQETDAVAVLIEEGWSWDGDQWQRPASPAVINMENFVGSGKPVVLPSQPVLQDIEQYRLQMAAICTAAIGYWEEDDGIHPDYDTLAFRDVAKLYAKYDELYKTRPVHHAVIAGALFDFMGWLTSREERFVLSSAEEASPAVDAIGDFAKMRGLSLDDAKVQDWNTTLPQRIWVQLTDEELSILGEKFTHPDEGIDEVDFGMEVQRILKEKNT